MDGDAVTANGLAIWTTQSEGLMCLLILDLALKVRLSDTSVLTIYAEAIPPVWNQGTSAGDRRTVSTSQRLRPKQRKPL